MNIRRLEDLYARPQWALYTEVRSATGAASDVRIADAIAVNLWPSGNFELHGFEQKVSRGDFRVELRDPEKSKIARFCTKWFLVVPAPWKKILVSTSELPRGWGLIEIGTGSPITVVEAPKKPAIEMDADLTRSLLRAGATQGADNVEIGAPMVAITRPDLSRARVGLACGHAAPMPLAKKLPAHVPCFACAEGRPADVELLEATIEDAEDEDLIRLKKVMDRRIAVRGLDEEVA